ncbi:MAG: hypothetical protein JRF31_04265 [Deltaproteobacteria bacterium]|nr:hypothetical protein [Deltaproteobacteria bacterium]MBW2320060.1 hypothetical protein [Deltaproteobacteria bacterium]
MSSRILPVNMDLSKFFDTVNHDVLMHRVVRKIKDKRVLKLIGKYLRAGVVVNGRRQVTRKGVPQDGPACRVVWGLGEKNPRLPDSLQR